MKQSPLTSLLKSLFSTVVGFAVAFVANMLILPWFGLPITHSANLLLTTIYTVISIARGYVLERVFEAMGWRMKISPFMSAVIAERQRQQDVEGWDHAHDDAHEAGELSYAGCCYAVRAPWHLTYSDLPKGPPENWPWSADWWKPTGFRRDLVKGAALIVAEGEKFDRSRKSQRNERTMTDDRAGSRSSLMNQNNVTQLAFNKKPSEHAGSSG